MKRVIIPRIGAQKKVLELSGIGDGLCQLFVLYRPFSANRYNVWFGYLPNKSDNNPLDMFLLDTACSIYLCAFLRTFFRVFMVVSMATINISFFCPFL